MIWTTPQGGPHKLDGPCFCSFLDARPLMTGVVPGVIWIDPNGLPSTACYELPPHGFKGRREFSTTTMQRFLRRKISASKIARTWQANSPILLIRKGNKPVTAIRLSGDRLGPV